MNKTSYKEIFEKIEGLKKKSTFPIDLDLNIYKKFGPEDKALFPSGAPFLINNQSDCQQCFYALQLDSFAEGCTHNCIYCWAKFSLSKTQQWNNPVPLPIDFSKIWEIFYEVFESKNVKKNNIHEVINQRIPIRIGSFSDPFLSFEKNLKVTRQLIRLFEFYNYPYLFVTRSALVAEDEYLKLMSKKNCIIQLSIPTLNEELTKILEPGAPSPSSRLEALQRLSKGGFKTVVRINPLFPTHADGYYSGKNNDAVETNFFDFSMLKTLSEHGATSILVGFVHLNKLVMEEISIKLSVKLSDLTNNTEEDFKYSDMEIRHYYEKIKSVAGQYNLKFSTCYLGLGEKYYWRDQDLWDNKQDCCDIKNTNSAFNKTSQEIGYFQRFSIQDVESTLFSKVLKATVFNMKDYILKNSINSR